jgi:iron(III) transport system permease protein
VLGLGNYAALATQPERWRPVVNSLWMASAATAAAVALGFAAAYLAVRRRDRWGAALESLIAAPWALPGTVFAVALAATFSVHAPWIGRFVLVGTMAILPLGYLVRGLPLTGRSAFAGLRQLDPALLEAAASLGASPVRRFRRVVVPHVRPALAAGASLAFLAALGDFVVSIVLYTYDTRPISIEILSSLRIQEIGVAAAYGVLLTLLSAAAFFLFRDREAAA